MSVSSTLSVDKFSDSVEISNACRRFYVSRLQAAETLRNRLQLEPGRNGGCQDTTDGTQAVCNSTADDQLEGLSNGGRIPEVFRRTVKQLRLDLVSLIDIDLQVMRQLLMLNDQLEELKWQHCQRRNSSLSIATQSDERLDRSSECIETPPQWSRGRVNNRWSCDVVLRDSATYGLSKYPTPSTLSLLQAPDCGSSVEDNLNSAGDSSVFDASPSVSSEPRMPCPISVVVEDTGCLSRSVNNKVIGQQSASFEGNAESCHVSTSNKLPVDISVSPWMKKTESAVLIQTKKQGPATKPKPKTAGITGRIAQQQQQQYALFNSNFVRQCSDELKQLHSDSVTNNMPVKLCDDGNTDVVGRSGNSGRKLMTSVSEMLI